MKWRSIFIFKLNKWMNSTYSSLVQSFNLKFSKSAARNVKKRKIHEFSRRACRSLLLVSVPPSWSGFRFFHGPAFGFFVVVVVCVCVISGSDFFFPLHPFHFVSWSRDFSFGAGGIWCVVYRFVSLFDQYPPKITPDTATLHLQSKISFLFVVHLRDYGWFDRVECDSVDFVRNTPRFSGIEGGIVTSRVFRLANPQGHSH